MTFSLLKNLMLTLAWLGLLSTVGGAHELRPSIADIEVTTTTVHLKLYLTLEPLIAGMDLQGLSDTNDSPLSRQHDDLRGLSPEMLGAELRAIWPRLQRLITLQAGETSLVLRIDAVEIPPTGNLDLPRDSELSLSADLPSDNTAITLGWGAGMGLLALRQVGDEASYEAMLASGDVSAALPRVGSVEIAGLSFFMQYIKIGVQHIIPKGLDHILFVLGLFLFSAAFRPLLWQITTFTLAHTITLALASLGLISVPSVVVEPLIAASITYVAIENIFARHLTRRRLFIIFGFGLLHGLGFASVLGEVGLQPARFITGLIGFNVGVEIGQLAVILVAFLLVGFWLSHRPFYRRAVILPGSILIGLIGAYWFVERVFL